MDLVYVPLPKSWNVGFGSFPGACMGGCFKGPGGGFMWYTETWDNFRQNPPHDVPDFSGIWGRFFYINEQGPAVTGPDWFLIGVAIALSAAPWLRWSNRFSLRTLLITTTLVAVVLGLIVWSINR